MKQVYQIDKNGFYIKDIILENEIQLPLDCIDVPFINGFQKPRWDGTKWSEGLSQEELDKINELKNKLQSKNELELLKEKLAIQEQTILELSAMIGGNK